VEDGLLTEIAYSPPPKIGVEMAKACPACEKQIAHLVEDCKNEERRGRILFKRGAYRPTRWEFECHLSLAKARLNA
jgi:hypothetical protein